jgi:hypothetical protein
MDRGRNGRPMSLSRCVFRVESESRTRHSHEELAMGRRLRMSVIKAGEVQREPVIWTAPTGKRMILNRLVVVCVAVCSAVPAIVAAQPASGSGRLEGIVVRQDGSGVGGVLMLVQEVGLSELTDGSGKYVFGRMRPGTYTVLSTLGPHSLPQPGVVITDSTTTTLRTVVDWPLTIFESVVVNGATRQPARLVEAPAAVTVLGSDELATQAPHGQLPRVLAGMPGVEVVQSGLYDFNLNSRGFNTFYNQRILMFTFTPQPPMTKCCQIKRR